MEKLEQACYIFTGTIKPVLQILVTLDKSPKMAGSVCSTQGTNNNSTHFIRLF